VNKDVKFGELRVGDGVEFLTSPLRAAPMNGVVSLLNASTLTFEAADGAKVSLRRASLVLEKRTRLGNGHSNWLFE
jgi:hypothetical protein